MRKHRKLLLGRLRRALDAAVLLTCAFSTLVTGYDQVMHASEEANSFDCLPTFVDIERSETHWREIFVAAEHSMGQRPLWELEPTHSLYAQIAALVPWELTRVAINRQPKVFRFVAGPHSHRASILLHDDRTISIYTEGLADIVNVRQRFQKPVILGIFIAGHAPERYPPEELHRQGTTMTSRAANPDTFSLQLEPLSSQLVEEEARVVGRLHTSMGHPSEEALIRLLGQHRVRPGVLDAVRGIDCEYCKRSKPPNPPHQVSMPRLVAGSFGDEVRADIFFFVLPTTHETVPVLGAICHHTNLHCAAVLRTDGDGAFRSCFSDWCTSHGIAHNISAGESPHLMGKIERHNFILKGCLT
eukprot:4020818-Amphidinium_carterae.2